MAKRFKQQDEYRMYNIDIILPSDPGTNEDKIQVKELAVSQWHAIEKAITKYSSIQPDRSKYKYIPSIFNKIRVR